MKISRARIFRICVGAMIVLGCAYAGIFLVQEWRENRASDSLPAPLANSLKKCFASAPWYDDWILKHSKQPIYVTTGRSAPPIPTSKWIPASIEARAYGEAMSVFQHNRDGEAELTRLGTNAWAVIPAVLNRLESNDPKARERAVRVLSRMGAERDPRVLQFLKSADLERPVETFSAIIGFPGGNFPPELWFAINGSEPVPFALFCLGHCGASARPVTPGILAMAGDKDDMRTNAIPALAALGTNASIALPDLKKIARNDGDDFYDRTAAETALVAVTCIAPDDSDTIEFLKGALRDRHGIIRIKAAVALWRFKIPATEVLPVIGDGLDAVSPSVRKAALAAIHEMGDAAAPLNTKAAEHE